MILTRAQPWPTLSFEDIKNRAKMLVIDDHDFAYEQLFRRDGYTVEKWDDLTDLSKLEAGKFDLLLLDLHGVGRSEGSEQGFAILKHLRHNYPAQIVIAYSAHEWSTEHAEFFRLADAVLSKSANYLEFKARVDEYLRQRFTPGFYVHRIQAELRPWTESIPGLDRKIQRAVAGRPRALGRDMKRYSVDPAAIDRVLSIVEIGLGIAGIGGALS